MFQLCVLVLNTVWEESRRMNKIRLTTWTKKMKKKNCKSEGEEKFYHKEEEEDGGAH